MQILHILLNYSVRDTLSYGENYVFPPDTTQQMNQDEFNFGKDTIGNPASDGSESILQTNYPRIDDF